MMSVNAMTLREVHHSCSRPPGDDDAFTIAGTRRTNTTAGETHQEHRSGMQHIMIQIADPAASRWRRLSHESLGEL